MGGGGGDGGGGGRGKRHSLLCRNHYSPDLSVQG